MPGPNMRVSSGKSRRRDSPPRRSSSSRYDDKHDSRYDDRDDRRDRSRGDRDRDRDRDRDSRERDRDSGYGRRDRDRSGGGGGGGGRDDRRSRDDGGGGGGGSYGKRRRDEDDDELMPRRRKRVRTSAKLEDQYMTVDPLAKLKKGDGKKKEPLSVEEVLKRQAAEDEAAAKPTFMTKAQREALALERRQQEVAAKRAHAAELSYKRREFGAGPGSRYGREAPRSSGYGSRPEREVVFEDENEKARRLEIEAIKASYMKKEKPKRKMQKPSEKFKVTFEWEPDEDTSQDINPLYQRRAEIALNFGRGTFAGTDYAEQMKKATIYEEITNSRRTGTDGRPSAPIVRGANSKVARMMAKDKHWTEKKLEDMTQRDWRIFREDFNIATKGGNVPNPIRSWKESAIPEGCLRAVEKAGYEKPSPIQMAAIPIGLEHRDLIGIAQTGSGKTCAFVVPMIAFIDKLPPLTDDRAAEGPYAIVLAPTRELAQQIEVETKKFADEYNYRTVCIVGGQSIEDQGFQVRQGAEIIVATPGRLNDMLERRYLVLNQCTYVIMDEADRMIDMGFEPQVNSILEALPVTNMKPEDTETTGNTRVVDDLTLYRVTNMFSATMPATVERLARKYLRNPAVVMIGSVGSTTDNITQIVMWMTDGQKKGKIISVLEEARGGSVIVFVNAKANSNAVARTIEKAGFSTVTLHGGKTQEQREDALEQFRTGIKSVLVATDVAGRGIDIDDVTHVVNYDMPSSIEPYTHRIGRTGRAGRTGTAISFLTASDEQVFYDLKEFLTKSGAHVPPELARHEAAKTRPGAIQQRGGKKDALFAM